MDPNPSIILLLSSKNCNKNLDCNCFVTSFDFLSLKNDATVSSKSNQQISDQLFFKLAFCWRLGG
jgi:hypothetical protein